MKALSISVLAVAAPSAFSLVLTDSTGGPSNNTVSHAFMDRFDTTVPFVQIWKYSSLLSFFQLPYGFVEMGLKGSKWKKKNLEIKQPTDETDLFSALRDGGGGLSET